jgi:hypothetical protein
MPRSFLQLLHFGMYLIRNEEKKAKKFERGPNSHIRIMMSHFDIRDFSQLVGRALIYKESLKENVDQKRRAQRTSVSAEGVWPAKRMAMGSFPTSKVIRTYL